MTKLNKSVLILLITIAVVFLFGCQGKTRKDMPPQGTLAETEQVQEIQAPNTVANPQEEKQAEPIKEKPTDQNTEPQKNTEAEQRLVFAQNNLKMAQKGILSYSQVVALCRGIIKDYPGTESEQKARQILRQVPEDLRSQYHLTNEELGL